MSGETWFNQTVCRELQVFFVSGQVKRTSIARLVQVILSARAIFFFLTLSVLMLAGNAFGFWDLMPMLVAFLLWPMLFIIYVSLLLMQYFLVAALAPKEKDAVVVSPLVGIICLGVTLATCSFCATYFSGGRYPGVNATQAILFYLVSQMVEVLFAQFMITLPTEDHVSPDDAVSDKAEPPEDQPSSLVFGDIQLPFEKLRFLEADEHYVRIKTTDGSMLKRVRMSDLVAQLGPEEGVRPHRSWWVSHLARPELKKHHGRQVLELECGVQVPVARGRLDDVRVWLEDQPLPADVAACNDVFKSP